ncbi:MAG: exopolysaccharide biosynthesis protein [Planctomycetes bacterium]|nr:exopolysaccharide biosynthesis protein [Planctomycetota bacterium]
MAATQDNSTARDSAATGADDLDGIVDVMDHLLACTEGEDSVAVGDIVEAFGARAFGPLLLLPALVGILPVGAIPVLPTVMGVFIVLVAVQRVFGRGQPWLPRVLRERSVARSKLADAFGKGRKWARRLDRITRPRLRALARGPMEVVVAVAVIGMGCLMPPLELIPFGVMLPASAVLVLGLALTGRDGVLVLVGLPFCAAAIALPIWYFW